VLAAQPDLFDAREVRGDLLDARDARDYWQTRARTLPRRRIRARREALETARRCERRLDDAARRALLVTPGPALRALVDVRRARLGRGLRRAAVAGLAAMAAAGAVAGVAANLLWDALAAAF
jgi:hypothetical protein